MPFTQPQPFSSRTVYDTPTLSIDFASRLSAGATIASFTVSAEVYKFSAQPDPSPEDTLDGSPQKNGTVILQKVQDGVTGAAYLYRFKVIDSNGEQIEADAYQAIAPALS